MEIWKDIEGYEGYYQVSNQGNVRSLDKIITNNKGVTYERLGKILSFNLNAGYPQIYLSKNGVVRTYRIHRLVAQAFIPNPENKPTVNHKDETRTNNNDWNLEWATYKENSNYGTLPDRFSIVHSGRQVSIETRNKLSEARRGYKHSEETCKKISEGNKGKIVSAATGRKISESKRKHKYTDEKSKKLF